MKTFIAKIIKASFISIIMSYALSVYAEVRNPEENFFQKSFGDYPEEIKLARELNKLGILIMFEQDECPYCYRMRTTILNQPAVQDYFKQYFSIFHVDIEGDTEIVDFDGKVMREKDFAFKVNRVRATPVFMFYDLDGKKVARYIGPTSTQDEFMLLGKYVVDKHYLTMSFTRFKQSQQL